MSSVGKDVKLYKLIHADILMLLSIECGYMNYNK